MHALACSEEKGGRVREQAECCGKNWFCDIKKSSIKIFYKCCITSIKTVLFFLWSWKNWCEFIQRGYCGNICRKIVRKGPGLEGSSETNGIHTSSQGMGDGGGDGGGAGLNGLTWLTLVQEEYFPEMAAHSHQLHLLLVLVQFHWPGPHDSLRTDTYFTSCSRKKAR